MTEVTEVHRSASGHSRSAVGRLTLLREMGEGTEKVTYERRWHDAGEARQWCEDKLAREPASAVVLEIQVTEEVWGRRHAWEATATRHIPETVQIGLRSGSGVVTWGEPHSVGSGLASRRAT